MMRTIPLHAAIAAALGLPLLAAPALAQGTSSNNSYWGRVHAAEQGPYAGPNIAPGLNPGSNYQGSGYSGQGYAGQNDSQGSGSGGQTYGQNTYGQGSGYNGQNYGQNTYGGPTYGQGSGYNGQNYGQNTYGGPTYGQGSGYNGQNTYGGQTYGQSSGYGGQNSYGGQNYGGSSGNGWFGNDQASRDSYDRGYRQGRDVERRSGMQAQGDVDSDTRAGMEFLDLARQRLDRGDARAAWVALGRAETRFMTRALPPGTQREAATGEAVGAIRDARSALEANNIDRARAATRHAMNLAERNLLVGRNVRGSSIETGAEANPGHYGAWGGGRSNAGD